MADLVDDFLQRLIEHCPELPKEKLLTVERAVRDEWGGSTPYIGKGSPSARKEQRLAQALAEGRSLPGAFIAAGVCRRMGYYMLKRPAKK